MNGLMYEHTYKWVSHAAASDCLMPRMRVMLIGLALLADIPSAIVFPFRRLAWIAHVYMKVDEGITQGMELKFSNVRTLQ